MPFELDDNNYESGVNIKVIGVGGGGGNAVKGKPLGHLELADIFHHIVPAHQLGDLGEKLVNSQFSQRQESEADDYSYDLLRKRGINPSGLATSFEKLAKLEAGRQSSMFDDHPASEARAQHIRDRMKADGIK